jgi:drug/metabolite transporter (DMT)-like permease
MAIIAWFAYGEAIDPMVLLGAVIIFGGNYYSVREEARS